MLAKGPDAFQTCRNRSNAMGRTPSSSDPTLPLPRWMRISGAAATACVAVLFVVVAVQVRQQGERLQALQDKVQTLENEKDLDRTNALEEQVRSTAQRLQGLEDLEQSVQRLSGEQASLRAELRSQVREPLPYPDANLEPGGRSPAKPKLPLPPLPSSQP